MQISVRNNIFLRTSSTPTPKGDLWFIHGYGESGLSFQEVFDSRLVHEFNIFVPDLPGFGATPYPDDAPDQKKTVPLLYELIRERSGSNPIFLVGHSQGGLIATWLCEKLGKRVKAYVNVEGNLTKADVTFSGTAAQKESPEDCKAHILNFIREHAKNEDSYWRYYASLRFASEKALLVWAKAGIEYTGEITAGEEYARLSIPKLYLWGAKSCPLQTREFLKARHCDNFSFSLSGHWPMLDQTDEFYKKVLDFFSRHTGLTTKRGISLPANFHVPTRVLRARYLLELLSPQHNDWDYAAWMSSREELKGIFGPKSKWPDNVTSKEENLQDLERHYRESQDRIAFTYTILDVARTECLGCLYIRPTNAAGYDCRVDFWFKNSGRHLENVFYEELQAWLKDVWQFNKIAFPGRSLTWNEYDKLNGG